MFLQRFIFIFLSLYLYLSDPAMAAQVTFSWIPNSETNLAGYNIYYGISSRDYTNVIDVGLPQPVNGRIQAAVDGLTEGETYYFSATAYDSQGVESDYSAEINYTVMGSVVSPQLPGQADFSWQPNTEPNLAGYKIYYGTASRTYTSTLDIGLPDPIDGRIHGTVTGLTEGQTYYFTATAYNNQGDESDYSDEIVYTVLAGDSITKTFGSTPDADYPDTLEETFTNINAQPLDGLETISTWSWSSPAPHKIANTALFKIDLSSIPATATIIEARLYLYQVSAHGEPNYINTVHKITGQNPIISEASGYNASSGTAWNSVPPGTTYNDVPLGLADIAAAEDTVVLDSSVGYRSWSITAMVSQWVADPQNNFGLLLNGQDAMTTETGRTFAASEHTDAGIRPKLVVTYSINNNTSPPTATDTNVSGAEDSPIIGRLDVNNPSGLQLQYTITANPTHGTLTVEDATGQFTYTPLPDVNGQDSFSFTAANDNGVSNSATVTVTVNPVNDPPTAQGTTVSTDEDTPASGQLSATDSDGDPLSFVQVTGPGNGTLQINSNGTFTYTPNANWSGTDTFSFKVNDGSIDSNNQTVTITVNPVNDAPIAQGTTISTDEDTPASGQLTATDNDGDTLSYATVAGPGNGTVQINSNGTFTYTPNVNWSGTDTFSFNVNDGSVDSNSQAVTITVNPLNDAPIAQTTTVSTNEDSPVSGLLSATDTDGDPLSYAAVAGPGNGTVQINSNGIFTYTPNANWSGTDTFTFKVNDGSVDSNNQTVTITVGSVNDAPVAYDLTTSVDAGGTVTGHLSATDVEGDSLNFRTVSGSIQGEVILNSDGSFTYTAQQDATGTDSFTYTTNDGNNDSNLATVTITITKTETAFRFELSEILVDSSWQSVSFNNSFTNPVVIARTASFNNPETGVVRVRNVTSTGLELRFQEWDSLDDQHPEETVTLMVIEAGTFTLDNGAMVEAVCFTASGASTFSPVSFQQKMTVAPVVMTAVNTVNEEDAVTTRIRNITVAGFEFKMREQETNTANHSEESACYLAWEPSSGSFGNMDYEVAATKDQITDEIYTISYDNQFVELPMVLASMQTNNGDDTAILRINSSVIEESSVFIAEEQSRDTETGHVEERAGYIAIAPYDLTSDPDGDTLSTSDEENIYHTHPGVADTDQDGMDDGIEITFWQEQGRSWDGDIDEDGLINLLDPDADGDGMADGMEVSSGFDPADPSSVLNLPLMEGGEVDVDSSWVHVELSESFNNPVVIAHLTSKKDNDPCVVRLDNVTNTGFDLRLQEYGYLDGSHPVEQVSYLVMEAGRYTLADGTGIEAGVIATNATRNYYSFTFNQEFSQVPVVITSTNTFNEADTVTVRTRNIYTAGFECKLQEQEANTKSHLQETLAYIAWEPSSGNQNGIRYEVNRSGDSMNHLPKSLGYTTPFNTRPLLYTSMQTTDGGDTSIIRTIGNGATSLEVMVEEEQSKDNETSHTKEVAGYIAILRQ